MKNRIKVYPIGKIENENSKTVLRLKPGYREGLKGLAGFSHVQILWWMDGCDDPESRNILVKKRPYVHGPEEIGVFALQSPERPNPVAVSCAGITCVDMESGTVGLDYIDAFSGSPVIDLKPYTPSLDRVEKPFPPEWCSHWPKSCEESVAFDWSSEFNF